MCRAAASVILVVVVVANRAKTISEYLQKAEEEGEKRERRRDRGNKPATLAISALDYALHET